MNDENTPIEKAAAELRAAVGLMQAMTPRIGRSWSPAVTFVGAAVAVTLVIGVPVLLSNSGSERDAPILAVPSTRTPTTMLVSSTTTIPPETTTIPTAPTCGTDLPFTAELPDDFAGPFDGASPQSPHPLEPGQISVHWTGRGGSVELRRPANAEYTENAVWGADPTTGESDATSFVYIQDLTIDGVEYSDVPQVYDRLPTEGMSGPCDAVQLNVFRPGGDQTEKSTFGLENPDRPHTLVIYPDLQRVRDLELIVESVSVETIPEVLECMGGSEAAGFEVPPIESETIASPVPFPTPVEALEALLGSTDRWPKTGYFEMHEPDGSITYGNPRDDMSSNPRPEDGLVISISVIPVDGGWAIDSWSTSGC